MTEAGIQFQNDVLLSQYTTIQTGGRARYFFECKSENEIIEALEFAEKNSINLQVISGGSNVIFSDDGFKGLVLKIDIKGIKFESENDFVRVKVKAGENWDDFVKSCIEKNLSGIECLSGIPGSTGATPVQNVGAYGQEVSDTIISVTAIEKKSRRTVQFSNDECKFEYRQSRFKNADKDRFIITEVEFRLNEGAEPEIKYPELAKLIDLKLKLEQDSGNQKSGKEKLKFIRDSVIELRKKKSMVIDVNDANTKSCGSFFTNPVLNEKQFSEFKKLQTTEFPYFEIAGSYKIPAAWLIENSGFHKGYRKNGAGISDNHSLAIINCGGNTKAILELSDEITSKVKQKFDILLEKEPVVII